MKQYIILFFLLLIILVYYISRHGNNNSSEKEIIRKLSYINEKIYDNKRKIYKETSFKISNNKINDKRFVYSLDVKCKKDLLTKPLFDKMLNYLDISKPYLKYFPNTDFKNIGEIILGIDRDTKKRKVYFTIPPYINALECLDNKCTIKKYYFKPTINLSKLSNLHPDAKEIYNHFQDSHSWEITKKKW